jgi:hypothetical protein
MRRSRWFRLLSGEKGQPSDIDLKSSVRRRPGPVGSRFSLLPFDLDLGNCVKSAFLGPRESRGVQPGA